MASKTKARLEIDVWYEERTRIIHIEEANRRFSTTVSRDNNSNRIHRHLFDKLAEILRETERPAPRPLPKPKGSGKPPRPQSRNVWVSGQAGSPGLGKRR